MMYSTGEISPEARRKPVGDEGEVGMDYIQGPRECDWVVGSQILTVGWLLKREFNKRTRGKDPDLPENADLFGTRQKVGQLVRSMP